MTRHIGDVVAGRYKLVSPLGSGGMGEVWRAEHLTLTSPVALKLLKPELVETDEARKRFEREARAAAAIRSQHVVQITDHGVDEGAPFIVMELLDGETLAERLRRLHTLTPRQTLRVITHIGRALAKAHDQGVVHRDVKPENIFITSNDDEEVIKLLDFGVVKLASSELEAVSRTKSGALIGTPLYMSPEQLRAKSLDHRSDLWSLAIVAYECLCGAPPFQSDSLADLIVEITREQIDAPSIHAVVPAGFDEWFGHATAREPGDRFQNVRDMVDGLRPILEAAPDERSAPSITKSMADAPTLAASVVTNATPKSPRRMLRVLVGVGAALAGISMLTWWLLPTLLPASATAPAPPSASVAPAAPPATQATLATPPTQNLAPTAVPTAAATAAEVLPATAHAPAPTRPAVSAKPKASASAPKPSASAAPAPPPPPTNNPLAF